ncbi:MAG: DNA polymerase III subunit chi [Burkholderiaceae bacterium]
MTRIDFHFNAADRLAYACRLVRKVHRAGHRIVVQCDAPELLRSLNEALWTFSPQDFIPHVLATDTLADRTPVLLADAEVPASLDMHEVLINLGRSTPAGFSRYERLIEVIGLDPADREAGRERWRFYRDRGYPLHTHDLSASGATA